MDLFGSKELSAEQRFMFMLDDKVDRLIDERNSIAVFHKYMNCQDPSEMSRDVFMRIHLKDKEAVKKLWEELGEMKCKVEGYTLASKDVLVQIHTCIVKRFLTMRIKQFKHIYSFRDLWWCQS